MEFTVSYRGKDGSRKREVIAAADRSALFRQLAERGITALEVCEGAVKEPSPRRSGSAAVRGAVAAAIVVAGAAVAFWLLGGGEKRGAADAASPGGAKAIAAVTAAAGATAAEAEAAKPAEIPYWERATTNGLTPMQLRKWQHKHLPPPGYTNDTSRTHRAKYAIFNYRSENVIAGYLSMKPGATLVGGGPRFDGWFVEDFRASLKEPIVINDDDSEEDRELKRLVRETKVDLKQSMDEGADLCEIMRATHTELQRLAACRREYAKELRSLARNEAYTAEDLNDYLTAANRILAEKGVEPIELGPVARRIWLKNQKGDGK